VKGTRCKVQGLENLSIALLEGLVKVTVLQNSIFVVQRFNIGEG